MIALSELGPDVLRGLPRDKTLFVFTVGTLEDNGPHLPLGIRSIISEKFASYLIEKLQAQLPDWRFVAVPIGQLGVQSITQELALPVRIHVLRDALLDLSLGLWKMGFFNFAGICFDPAPRMITLLEEMESLLKLKTGTGFLHRWGIGKAPVRWIALTSALIESKQVFASPLWPDPEENGGKTLTSLALRLCPELVAPIYQSLPNRSSTQSHLERSFSRFSRKITGYWGAPAEATRDYGNTLLETYSELITRPLVTFLQSDRPSKRVLKNFKTPYRYFLPNRSLFKIWLITGMIFILALFWIAWTLQTFTL